MYLFLQQGTGGSHYCFIVGALCTPKIYSTLKQSVKRKKDVGLGEREGERERERKET